MLKAGHGASPPSAEATEGTPGSDDFARLTGVSRAKLEERRVVGGDGIEPPTLAV